MSTPQLPTIPNNQPGGATIEPPVQSSLMPNQGRTFMSAEDQRAQNRELLAQFGIKVDKGQIVDVAGEEPDGGAGEPEDVGSSGQWSKALAEPEVGGEGGDDPEGDLLEAPPAPQSADVSKKAGDEETRRARQANRDLLKTEKRLKTREAAIDQKLEELQKLGRDLQMAAQMATQSPVATMAAIKQDPVVSEFFSTYDQFGEVLDKLITPVYAELERRRQDIAELNGKLAKYMTNQVADQVIGKVLQERPDAKELVSNPLFLEWLAALPPKVQTEYTNIINQTSNYTAEDALFVFDQFDGWRASQGYPTNSPQSRSPQRPAAPAQRVPLPADGLPPMRRSNAGPASGNQAVTPLSMDELMHYDQLLAISTPAQRETLKQRRMLTMSGGYRA